jgi:hypothetical protein
MDLNVISAEPQWYSVREDRIAGAVLAQKNVTSSDVIDLFKNQRVFGHVYENRDGTYTVSSWDNTYGKTYKSLTTARLALIGSVDDEKEREDPRTSPFMEIRRVMEERKPGYLTNYETL